MRKKTIRFVVLAFLVQVAVAVLPWTALGQTETAPYAAMAPLDQYLIPDQNAEIALARSAAPASIADGAEVLVPVSYTHLDVYKRQVFDGDQLPGAQDLRNRGGGGCSECLPTSAKTGQMWGTQRGGEQDCNQERFHRDDCTSREPGAGSAAEKVGAPPPTLRRSHKMGRRKREAQRGGKHSS